MPYTITSGPKSASPIYVAAPIYGGTTLAFNRRKEVRARESAIPAAEGGNAAGSSSVLLARNTE